MTAKKMTYAEYAALAKQASSEWGAPLPIHTIEFVPAQAPEQSTKLRKVYAKITQAMAQAKADEDTALYESLKVQHKTLMEALTQDKAARAAQEADDRAALEECFALAIAQLRQAMAANTTFKLDNDRLRAENQALRSPPPTEEYKKAQTIRPNPIRTFSDKELLQEIDAMLGPV